MRLSNFSLINCALLIVIMFSSCSYLYKGKAVFTVVDNTSGSGYISEKRLLTKTEPVAIEDKGSYLVMKFENTTPGLSASTTHNIPVTNLSVSASSDFLTKYTSTDLGLYDAADKCNSKTSYFDIRPVFQGLTIPIKIRPRLTTEALADSFPSQVESGFNAGLSIGVKMSHNMFRTKKNFLGLNTTRLSFTPGWFVGLGKVDLKKTNTRTPIVFERSAAMVSTGGYLMLGFNNVNFGYSFGWDYATGYGRDLWVYKGKFWHGVVIAFDIIK